MAHTGLRAEAGRLGEPLQPRSCDVCKTGYVLLTVDGFVHPGDAPCPSCTPDAPAPNGVLITLDRAEDWRSDRRALESVAADLAAGLGKSREETVRYMEGLESQPEFQQHLARLVDTGVHRGNAWGLALRAMVGDTVYSAGEVEALQMAAGRGIDPELVERVVVKHRGKVVYDGPPDVDAVHDLLDRHPRARVTMRLKGGGKRVYRGGTRVR
jgi:hypothetical protein